MVNANSKLTFGFSHFSFKTKTEGPRNEYKCFAQNAETETEVAKFPFLS